MGPEIVTEILRAWAALGIDISSHQVLLSESRGQVDTVENALLATRSETGVDLSTSQVRVGFSRGHLLEVVVKIPLDIPGDPEALQVAAEMFLEESVGPERLDTWVACVSVDRIRRSSGLVMAAGDTPTSSPPLLDAPDLIARGIQAVTEGLPSTLLGQTWSEGWAALEIPRTEEGLQAEREFASTCFPEALKAVLEGLPFSSTRFTRGAEVFVWVSWSPSAQARAPLGASLRLAERTRVEALANAAPQELALVGSGFGRTRDYLDLWLRPNSGVLEGLVRRLAGEVGQIEVGFYDDVLRGLSLVYPEGVERS
jgi:hypothetical protein